MSGLYLKMAKADYNVDGLAQGEIAINPHGPGSGIFVDVWVDDISINDLKYEEMKFKGHLQDKVWYFDDVKLMEQRTLQIRESLLSAARLIWLMGSWNLRPVL